MAASDLPIIQYWHADPPGYILDLIETFRGANRGAQHLVFDESSAAAFIAEHFSPREVTAFRACAVPAMQSDYLRYCAVLALGGIYCDVAYRCKASLRTLLEGRGIGRVFRRPTGQVVNGFFGFDSPGHPVLELALEIATANIEQRVGEHAWQTTGPAIFTALWRFGEANSIAEFVAQSRDAREGNLEPAARSLEALVSGQEQVLDATDGVRVAPLSEVARWLDQPGVPLPYKQGPTHWLGYESPMFREDDARD